MIGGCSISDDNCGVKKNVGGVEFVEQVSGIDEIAEASGAEADELEGVEMSVAMTECDEMGLKLLEVVEVIAFVQNREYMPVEAR